MYTHVGVLYVDFKIYFQTNLACFEENNEGLSMQVPLCIMVKAANRFLILYLHNVAK